MKNFFISLSASIIGFGIVLGFSFLLVMGMFVTTLTSIDSTDQYVVKKNSVLHLNLYGEMCDKVDRNSFLDLLGENEVKISLSEILNAIELAKQDKKIKGIYIKSGYLSASSASLKEIRDALIDFKTSTDKFIISYGDIYTQGSYYLSSVSDKVILNPEGNVNIQGYSASPMFYKGLLDKLGVEMQIFRVGTFKSAVEPYINTEMSDANKEQVLSYISDMWSTLATDISVSRRIAFAKMDEVANYSTALRDPQYVLDNNLVDTLLYESEAHNYLKELMGVELDKKIVLASPANLVSAHATDKKSNKNNTIAVLYAEGTINSGNSREGITDQRYIKELKALEDDEKVKAVVFRINSPGGSAYASEQIWKAVTDLKAKKPIVISMGGVAASGGYYISAGASKIFAQPNTITGSIGIFGVFPNVEGLTNKIGLTFDNVKTHQHADFGDISRPMRTDEKEILQSYVERGYDLFLRRCAEGRNLSIDSINNIAQGRVWTGNQALKIGLVDEIGGIDDAINEAALLAGLSSFSTVSYPKPIDFMESFLLTKKNDFASQFVKDYLGVEYNTFKILKEIREQDYLQARIPYNLDVQ